MRESFSHVQQIRFLILYEMSRIWQKIINYTHTDNILKIKFFEIKELA